MTKQSFFGGVAILFFGGVIAKALGAFYKIPLTWLLGTEGLGLYQLVFPLFSSLLIVSSTGMPTAISKLVSQKQNALFQNKILYCSLKFLFTLCIVFCILLLLIANFVAELQSNAQINILYYAIAPSIVFVGVISAFRGYFQGKLNMFPTTLSNVCEQLCKIAFGLSFSAIFVKQGVLWGAFGAVLGVVVSEFVTMILMIVLFKIEKDKQAKQFGQNLIKENFKLENLKVKDKKSKQLKIETKIQKNFIKDPKVVKNFDTEKQKQQNNFENIDSKQIYKSLIKTSFPIVISSLIIPLSLSIDSILVVNLLKNVGYSAVQSVCLWGISSGMINTLINLPVAITLCVATTIVPYLSNTEIIMLEKQKKVYSAFYIVALICLPFVVVFGVLSPEILNFLFKNTLLGGELNQFYIATKLLILSCPLVFLICVLQTQTAVLQGQNKLYIPVLFVFFSVLLKTAVLIFAVNAVGIYGVVISNFVLYFVATLLNTVYLKKKLGLKLFNKKLFAVVLALLNLFVSLLVFKNVFLSLSVYVALPLELLCGGLIFLISLFCLNVDFLTFAIKNLKTKVYNRKFGKRLS